MTTTPQPNAGAFRQTAIGLLALAVLWNAVYWLWPIHRQAPVVMASTEATAPAQREPASPEPEPVEVVQVPDPEPQIVDPVVVDPLSELGVLAPQFHLHTVTARDRNLGDIASHYYGDKALFSVIAQANPYKDPRRLAEGQVWRVPIDPTNIQGIVVDADGNPAQGPPPTPPSVAYTEYVVRDGDTLGAISRMHYDTTRHAEFLYAFNKERLGLRSIRAIRQGQVLHIPPEPK
jgi:nucleoid-associated protein YgaU